jgi:helicase MOV-10
VEAMLQLLQRPDVRIFACAPSNAAADIIALRLVDYHDLGPDELFRYYAPSRLRTQVPDRLEKYSFSKNGLFGVPDLDTMNSFRVVVSTCVSASVAHGIGMKRGHFKYIFVDEAGQASEPEVMIPIMTMADDTTNVVLSGDPRQLGPVIRSPNAQDLNLSYAERLMKSDAYHEEDQRGKS